MKATRIIMGMPITIEVNHKNSSAKIKDCFNYFKDIDSRFSTYKKTSEVSLLNQGHKTNLSLDMQLVLDLCDKTARQTNGFFQIYKKDDTIDPSGLVKGWAIQNAANQLLLNKLTDFYIEAGGDIQVYGLNQQRQPWEIGIRNPFNITETVKVIRLTNAGVATSGNYIRGSHIYNPLDGYKSPVGIASLTVIGPNVYHADRLATAAFAMGEVGINFIERLKGYEAYMINTKGIATLTSGFNQYVS